MNQHVKVYCESLFGDHNGTAELMFKDPKDGMVLKAAVNGSANTIATFNVRDFKGAENFGVEVIQPGEFVRRLKQ